MRVSTPCGRSTVIGCHSERAKRVEESQVVPMEKSRLGRFEIPRLRARFACATLGMTLVLSGCDRGVKLVQDRMSRGSRTTID